jgi:hypothetical protein
MEAIREAYDKAPRQQLPMRCPMKLRYTTMAIAGFVLSATTAFAAPQRVEDACWRYANRVTPYLTQREKEAYITNCIADWTAGTPPPQGRRSYDRNRYGIPSTQHPGP